MGPRGCEVRTPREEFDRIQEISKRLRLIFSRDGYKKHDVGSDDYIVRSVEEAQRMTELCPAVNWVCDKCKTFNDDKDSLCRFCDTPRLSDGAS